MKLRHLGHLYLPNPFVPYHRFEPGAVVCRVAPSFVRFGTFQVGP